MYENPKTVVSEEYPTDGGGSVEPYYPINDAKNNELAANYRALSAFEHKVYFGGRLAEYKYYDMDVVVKRAMELWTKIQAIQ